MPDIEAYDAVYQRLIAKLDFSNLSSSIAMEEASSFLLEGISTLHNENICEIACSLIRLRHPCFPIEIVRSQ